MKILRALIGYLSATDLLFHSFTFAAASPLAATSIDYDGYVGTQKWQNHPGIDRALLEHVLGNIVETCQAVTMENHSNSALVRRVPGGIIEARQPEIILVTSLTLVALVVAIELSIYQVLKDKPVRCIDSDQVEFPAEHFD